uniref:Uncharacterized protein n=1 Tax=Pyrodinium bahamense TaxID=73915 RepID=A0A7S0FAL1_9DINO|mmetsp:Transcript_15579/g.43047  ORF Transcript_15579/g.43047 Transcript_15579/m.43047 type:complete len:196 (+) Transcript_15579:62-649(+)
MAQTALDSAAEDPIGGPSPSLVAQEAEQRPEARKGTEPEGAVLGGPACTAAGAPGAGEPTSDSPAESHPAAVPLAAPIADAAAGVARAQQHEAQPPAYQERLQGRVQKLSAIRAQRQVRDQEADEASSCCYRSAPRFPAGRGQRLPRNVDRRAASAAVGMPPPRPPPVEPSWPMSWVTAFFARTRCCSIRDPEDT